MSHQIHIEGNTYFNISYPGIISCTGVLPLAKIATKTLHICENPLPLECPKNDHHESQKTEVALSSGFGKLLDRMSHSTVLSIGWNVNYWLTS